jgi:hypothetical protein
LVWRDSRVGGYDIYIQGFDAMGNITGTSGGVAVCTASGTLYPPVATTDGAGGVIVAWRDNRGSDFDVYAQRIDGYLNTLWTTNGVTVCNATGSQIEVQIVTDDTGGAIVVWSDERAGSGDIYAQRIDPDGNVLWTPNGVAVCTDPSYQYAPCAGADGSGGVIIAWEDFRNGNYDVYAQRLYSNGNGVWTNNGLAVCTETSGQYDPLIAVGHSQDAIIAWQDYRSAHADIYAQRVAYGSTSWTANGVAICSATDIQVDHDIIPDGLGGAYICWSDDRNSSTIFDVYAARVDIAGNLPWTTNGVAVSTEYFSQRMPAMVSDGEGGLIITWKDRRVGNYDIYAQRLDGDGNIKWSWGSDGIPVCSAGNYQYDPVIATDGSGGALIAWEDTRLTGYYDIFAQRMERNGRWGYPAPAITAVRDVPGDQGGYVNLAWDASRLDPWPAEEIYHYTVWRAIEETEALMLARNGAPILRSPSEIAPDIQEGAIRMETLGGEEFYWEMISTVEAYYIEHYSEVEETLFDSTGVCKEYHYFQVIAHNVEPSIFWISEPDSGYSVDNLSPCPPLGLGGEQQYSPEGLQLTWDQNSEADMYNYNIYRGTEEGFVPGPGNLIASPCDTTFFDSDWRWDSGYWYKVAAVDIHGNESDYAVLGSDQITGDEDPKLPAVNFMAQNYPNPFNPVTTIRFGLKEAGHVKLTIYDTAGRRVSVLLDERRPAGRYQVDWTGKNELGNNSASGVYFYMLEANGFSQRRKMVLLR